MSIEKILKYIFIVKETYGSFDIFLILQTFPTNQQNIVHTAQIRVLTFL